MKSFFGFMTIAFILVLAGMPADRAVAAPTDTLSVEWADGTGNLILNALYNAVAGDTVAGGARANLDRVYKVRRGGYYWNTETIVNSGFTLRIVGEAPGTAGLEQAPAVLQIVARADKSKSDKIITGQNSVVLKNLYFLGTNDDGAQNAYQPVQIDANNSNITVDHCVFERSICALIAFTGENNIITFKNCIFRNLIGHPSTQQWEGRGISIWADQDTVIVENNTFFNCEFTALQIENGAAKYLRFNHNTMVNIGRNFITGTWWREAYFANNLVINGFWHGEGLSDVSTVGRDPRAYSHGMIEVADLPTKYGPEEGRRILVANTALWRDPLFDSNYYGDSIRVQYLLSPLAKLDHFDNPSNVQMKTRDTVWLSERPNITTYVTPQFVTDSMISHIKDLRAGVNPARPYFWGIPYSDNADTAWAAQWIFWPLPENFTYSTPSTLLTSGTDGLPLGDLNWFPAQLKTFESKKAKFVSDMQNLAGGVITLNVDTTAEAEIGALGGSASVKKVTAFSYYRFESGGDIVWKFNLPNAVPNAKLCIYVDLAGQNPRGEYIVLNGANLTNNTGFGEYHFTSPPLALNAWDSVLITKSDLVGAGSTSIDAQQAALDIPAGANTLELRKSWGWDQFSGFAIYDASGNLVMKQGVPDADSYSGGIAHVDGAKWAPNGMKFVDLGSAGTVTWHLTVGRSGLYTVSVAYQNINATTSADLSCDGTTLSPIALASKPDSTGLIATSNPFNITAGVHTFVLTGGGANIDYIQLIEHVISGIDENNGVPYVFRLDQNYPNPFNPSTLISFSLGKPSDVHLTVYNILGQKIAILLDRRMNEGPHAVRFDAGKLATGIYFYRLEAGDFKASRKMILMK